MREPEFLDVEEVIALHGRQLEEFGGSSGIRDRGLLESAVAMPAATFGGAFVHEDLFAMAAAYAFHIAENQPFVDGNKRAGLYAALAFLRMNGYRVVDPATPRRTSRPPPDRSPRSPLRPSRPRGGVPGAPSPRDESPSLPLAARVGSLEPGGHPPTHPTTCLGRNGRPNPCAGRNEARRAGGVRRSRA